MAPHLVCLGVERGPHCGAGRLVGPPRPEAGRGREEQGGEGRALVGGSAHIRHAAVGVVGGGDERCTAAIQQYTVLLNSQDEGFREPLPVLEEGRGERGWGLGFIKGQGGLGEEVQEGLGFR